MSHFHWMSIPGLPAQHCSLASFIKKLINKIADDTHKPHFCHCVYRGFISRVEFILNPLLLLNNSTSLESLWSYSELVYSKSPMDTNLYLQDKRKINWRISCLSRGYIQSAFEQVLLSFLKTSYLCRTL